MFRLYPLYQPCAQEILEFVEGNSAFLEYRIHQIAL